MRACYYCAGGTSGKLHRKMRNEMLSLLPNLKTLLDSFTSTAGFMLLSSCWCLVTRHKWKAKTRAGVTSCPSSSSIQSKLANQLTKSKKQADTNQEELSSCSMEGREGIAVAVGHESGHGMFGADISMTEAQEAAKEYHSSASFPSTSPTPSPPPVAPGQREEAAATPLPWSFGAEKPSEAAGDNGVQTAGLGEHANLSSGRRRGRPRGSGRRQILATLGEWYALSAGGSFTPHVIIVGTGEDVAARIMSFSQKGPRSVCILSANGTMSNVTLRQPDSSGNFTYEGHFEILQLMGSFTMAEEGRRRTGGLSVSLAGPDGRVIGGVVAGTLRAASPIQVIVGSFLPNSIKQHQRRMNLQPQPSPASVLTAAMPISQASPGNGFHAARPPSQQARASADHGRMGMNLNAAAGFTMAGWPPNSQSTAAHGSSPDINVSLTPQE